MSRNVAKTQGGKGGGARKIGSNKTKCLRYRSENRRDKAKARRIERMMRRFPKYKIPKGWKKSKMKEGLVRG
jgi:hypothetical protein